MNERNFMKAFSNFKTVLNTWKTRQLTIYGRLEVVRSLAISKIMYVLNMLDPPKGFCKDVQNAINGFVWKNKTAKVKYSTAVGMYIDGGLKLPNIDIRYKTQRIMWMSNLISKYNGTVKNLLNQICKDIGGLQNVSFNFDIDCLPKRCEPFYISCFREWSAFFHSIPSSVDDVLNQPLWNNKFIKINNKSVFYKNIFDMKVRCIKDVIDNRGKFRNIISSDNILSFRWQSLLHAIPIEWKRYLKLISEVGDISDKVSNMCINKLKSANVYNALISNFCKEPSVVGKIGEKGITRWQSVYECIYKCTNDTYLREFQFKTVNNYLPVAQNLFKWKLKDSPRCSYCFLYNESVDHLFFHCNTARNLYFKLQEWMETVQLSLPKYNMPDILYGILPANAKNSLTNTIILIFKYTLFKSKDEINPNLFLNFKYKLSNINKVEYIIASKNNKKNGHLFCSCLNNVLR